jgi:predicted phosphodiesterase
MKLLAISDLHVSHASNRRALETIGVHGDDWLIVAGDVGETEDDLTFTIRILRDRFARVLWVPGNHELWTLRSESLRGESKYMQLVDRCRSEGVLTPEDPFPVWRGAGGPRIVAPLFVLYDYSFRPDGVTVEEALALARESGIECADEHLLHPDPHASRADWCAARCDLSESRLEEAIARHRCPTVLVNHFPLRRELAVLPLIPRFSLWCGTRRTEDWHVRFHAEVVVSGHLHIRQTRMIDGVRFEEVSLGYARQWNQARTPDSYFRQILPNPLP